MTTTGGTSSYLRRVVPVGLYASPRIRTGKLSGLSRAALLFAQGSVLTDEEWPRRAQPEG